MPSTKTPASQAKQPPRSDAPADAASGRPPARNEARDAGGNHGSPAAPVMKQFAKTESESRGKRK